MLPRLTVLLSYAFLRYEEPLVELMLALSDGVDFMVDSGAFTNEVMTRRARVSGAAYDPVTLDEYIAFCHRVAPHVWGYIMLDKMGDPVATNANLARMADAGLRPMPVYVRGHTEDDLAHLLAVNDRLCVGGAVGARPAFTLQRFQRVHEASHRRARIHALGFTKMPTLLQVPVVTCDSSSWMSGARYGTLTIFTGASGMQGHRWRDLAHPTRGPALVRHLTRLGVPPRLLRDDRQYRGVMGLTAMASTVAYLQLHQFLTAHRRAFFFATPSRLWLFHLLAVAATYQRGTFNLPAARAHYHALLAAARRRSVAALADLIRPLLHGGARP